MLVTLQKFTTMLIWLRQISTKVYGLNDRKRLKGLIKLTLLEGMMKLSNQHVELLVEYVETLMSWIKPDNHVYNPELVCKLGKIADEYEALKEASNE